MASRNRGVKKPKLRDLSQHPLNYEEQMALLHAVDMSTPPIAAAILGAVLVEHEIENSLREKMPRKSEEVWLSMLDEQGPYSTFARKITAGHALNLYDEPFAVNLNIVRVIRNTFAHSKRLIDFDHPLIAAELKRVVKPKVGGRSFAKLKELEPKPAYLALCMLLTREILKRRNRAHAASDRKKNRKSKKQAVETSPLYRLLAPGFGLTSLVPKDGPKPPLQSFLESQNVDPSLPAPQGLLGGLLGLGEHSLTLRNSGKKK